MAEAGVKVTYKDDGLHELFGALRELGKMNVVVGIRGRDVKKTYPSGASVGLVAKVMEFGSRTVPRRPFMRHTVERYGDDIARAAAEEFSNPKFLDHPEVALEAMGREAAGFVVDSIDGANSWARPDQLATVQEKGATKPLVDTGLLRSSISWAVRDGRTVIKEGKP